MERSRNTSEVNSKRADIDRLRYGLRNLKIFRTCFMAAIEFLDGSFDFLLIAEGFLQYLQAGHDPLQVIQRQGFQPHFRPLSGLFEDLVQEGFTLPGHMILQIHSHDCYL